MTTNCDSIHRLIRKWLLQPMLSLVLPLFWQSMVFHTALCFSFLVSFLFFYLFIFFFTVSEKIDCFSYLWTALKILSGITKRILARWLYLPQARLGPKDLFVNKAFCNTRFSKICNVSDSLNYIKTAMFSEDTIVIRHNLIFKWIEYVHQLLDKLL